MKTQARLLGHSIHTVLNDFPFALFTTALLFDIAYRLARIEIFDRVAYYNIAAGLLFGVGAAVFGYIDFFRIPDDTRAKRVGMLHGFGNTAVLLLFSFSWLLRYNYAGQAAPPLAVWIAAVAVLLNFVTVWLGRELTSRMGMQVSPGANLNAPGSLSGRPADRPTVGVPVTGEGEGTVTPPEDETDGRPPGS